MPKFTKMPDSLIEDLYMHEAPVQDILGTNYFAFKTITFQLILNEIKAKLLNVNY